MKVNDTILNSSPTDLEKDLEKKSIHFDEHHVIHELKHYLPAQAPLKDFIHHNTLHAFQKLKFDQAIYSASEILGYRVSLSLAEYRKLYEKGEIKSEVLERVIAQRKGASAVAEWKENVLHKKYEKPPSPRVGSLRANWKRLYQVDLDSMVHPLLFRTLCSYLDQGIAMWNFPVWEIGFLSSIREIERNSFNSFFRTERARHLILHTTCEMKDLLQALVGDESLFEQYLFDQQFAHQGWSGMVSVVEDQPQTLLDHKKISLHELIIFELLLEIDALELHFGKNWEPLTKRLKQRPPQLFGEVAVIELYEVTSIWQEAMEWSYYDQVLNGLRAKKPKARKGERKTFQAMFCIDDRECSFRHYLESIDPNCETFGTPGFFGVEFFFQPEGGKFYTKLCPAPVTPKFLIKEMGANGKRARDVNFSKHSHSLFRGWLITQTLGFWSAMNLFLNIFRPTMSPATASSFRHMDKYSTLTIENKDASQKENDLQIGFQVEEMANRVEGLLKSIGLVKNFAPLVYVVGHGSSSVNNPHFAAYDCGACSGRAGSVNSRVICYMANHAGVRAILKERGITIPAETQFVGGLHDTTRDEVMFFDEDALSKENAEGHFKNEVIFTEALDFNAKERSRRFESIDTRLTPQKIHDKIKTRSVSLFEPRPELNHATNALCIVGRRSLTENLFLDRRAFMNSYDYSIDPDGKILLGIIRPLGPVCGGINLEYFFSRVDNQKLGAGTKLPHNVMGLFGVANGIDGDLRPGLPSQMIEVHDPVRLLIIVEHFPEVVLEVIKKQSETYEWFINEWVHLIAVNPETKEFHVFKEGVFHPYQPTNMGIQVAPNRTALIEKFEENIPVHTFS
jgi:uncharacterized protein YbcC (UPF0753/DUF2309 family)